MCGQYSLKFYSLFKEALCVINFLLTLLLDLSDLYLNTEMFVNSEMPQVTRTDVYCTQMFYNKTLWSVNIHS